MNKGLLKRMQSCVKLPLSELEAETLAALAVDWALTHGITMRTDQTPNSSEKIQHASFVLFPSPLPHPLLFKVKSIQATYNLLYHNLSHDHDFLKKTLANTIKVDEFTRRLWNIYEASRRNPKQQEVSLGLFRSDYMLDMCQSSIDSQMPKQAKSKDISIKQIEFNTIAASFSGLANQVSEWHKYLLTRMELGGITDHIPVNESSSLLANGLSSAWSLYTEASKKAMEMRAAILFVIEPITKNIFDQRWMEFSIHRLNSSIPVIRKTLLEVYEQGEIDKNTQALIVDGREIAVVYFRDGYSPNSYPTEKEWKAREMMELSMAIKCPSIQYHLAGTKKIQQELCRAGTVEKFIPDSESSVRAIRETFAGQFTLDMNEEGDKVVAMVKEIPERYVMKPQREGGGNNIFGIDILQKLKDIETNQDLTEDRSAFILMEKITPPSFKNYILRVGTPLKCCDVVSELGIYGIIMGTKDKVILNMECGHLLRSKQLNVNEGGIVEGQGALDSPYLV